MFAAEIFDNLSRLGEDTADRVREATVRCNVLLRQLPVVEAKVRQTEIAVVEDDIQKKNATIRSSVTIPTVITKNTNCSQINAQYNTCSLPPQLWKIESIVPEDCMIAFSNPGFFFDQWLKGEQLKQEEQRKERKKNKELKKKTKLEKRNKRRNKDSKSSLAGHEKSLMRQRMDLKSKKSTALPPPLAPPEIGVPDYTRKSSSFRIFDSFDAISGLPPPQEELDTSNLRPPPAQQPLRRPPPGAVRKLPSGVTMPPPSKRASVVPSKQRNSVMHKIPLMPPPASEEPSTPPPPPSPQLITPTATPSLPASPEPETPPPPDEKIVRRPPLLNIPPQQLPLQPPRRKNSILNYGVHGTVSPTRSLSGAILSEADAGSGLDPAKKPPKRRQSVIQSANFMKSPSVVGSQSTKSPGLKKLFSSNALTPEAIAALTINPDSTTDTPSDKLGSTVTSGLTRRTSVGARVSPQEQQTGQRTAPAPNATMSSKIRAMESIVEDNEDTESRASSQPSHSRRGSVTKSRIESGGYQGGVNPFTSEALAQGTGEGTKDDVRRRKSFATQSSMVSALTDGFDSFANDAVKDSQKITHQLSTFAEEDGRSASPIRPTGISQALSMESLDDSPPPKLGYDKERFSMDINDAWYRNSFMGPGDRQQTANSGLNNTPISEYAFVPMAAVDGIGGSLRRGSTLDHRSVSMPTDQNNGNRRKSFLSPFRSSGDIEGSGPTQADVDALNAARLHPQDSGLETAYSNVVHNVNSYDDAGDLEPNIDLSQPPIDGAEYEQPSEYDNGYGGDYNYSEDTAAEGGGGGYYLATDGNYYYYEDAEYYATPDENHEAEYYDQTEADQLWEQRTGFLSAIKDGDITLRRTPATEKYMDIRSDVLAQIRTGAVHLKKMQPTMKPSSEQVGI